MSAGRPGSDLDRSAALVAARLGGVDRAAVRSLLAAWWSWAGMMAQRGGVMDSDAFVAQREAEGLLELPPDLAARAIELELAYLHGLGDAQREPATQPRPRRPVRRAPPSSALVGTVAFGVLVVLVGGGLALGEAVRHVPLPGGADEADTAPYRAWIGILAGLLGVLGGLLAMRLRPDSAAALRVPTIGLAALGLFGLGLLAGASWLEYSAGALFVLAGAAAWLGGRR